MTDLELYVHFNKYVFEVRKDGYCFVRRFDYNDFTKYLPINSIKEGFDAVITFDGNLCFDIDDVSHFFDDFETFKETFMKEKVYDQNK